MWILIGLSFPTNHECLTSLSQSTQGLHIRDIFDVRPQERNENEIISVKLFQCQLCLLLYSQSKALMSSASDWFICVCFATCSDCNYYGFIEYSSPFYVFLWTDFLQWWSSCSWYAGCLQACLCTGLKQCRHACIGLLQKPLPLAHM